MEFPDSQVVHVCCLYLPLFLPPYHFHCPLFLFLLSPLSPHLCHHPFSFVTVIGVLQGRSLLYDCSMSVLSKGHTLSTHIFAPISINSSSSSSSSSSSFYRRCRRRHRHRRCHRYCCCCCYYYHCWYYRYWTRWRTW